MCERLLIDCATYYNKTLVLVLCLVSQTLLLSQEERNPRFSNFKGSVYELPLDSLPFGYRPYVEDLEPVSNIDWKKIMVRVRETSEPFTDIEMTKEFGIIFKNQMMVPEDGFYEFILASDDGSKLWIDGELIVDNDGVHHMKVARDSINLTRGLYNIKIWYYQAFPSKYGFIFDSRYLGPAETTSPEPIVWDGDILFEFDHYELSNQGFSKLDSLITLIYSEKIDAVTIMGHTDDIGSNDYNYTLSEKRAQSIKKYIESSVNKVDVKLTAIGYGEHQPRVPNNSSVNRAKNRRVELLLNQ